MEKKNLLGSPKMFKVLSIIFGIVFGIIMYLASKNEDVTFTIKVVYTGIVTSIFGGILEVFKMFITKNKFSFVNLGLAVLLSCLTCGFCLNTL